MRTDFYLMTYFYNIQINKIFLHQSLKMNSGLPSPILCDQFDSEYDNQNDISIELEIDLLNLSDKDPLVPKIQYSGLYYGN